MAKAPQDPEIQKRFLLGLQLYEDAVDQERLRALREDPFLTQDQIEEQIQKWHLRSRLPTDKDHHTTFRGSPKSFYSTLTELEADLRDLEAKWAIIGGLAFLIRIDARHTRDIDLALSVANQKASERLYRDLLARGYQLIADRGHFENIEMDRTSTLRLCPPGIHTGVVVDFLLASCGIEKEITEAAEMIEINPGLTVPVARKEHLLAMKVLAGRSKDRSDALALISAMSPVELSRARSAIDLIGNRGFHRNKNLHAELDRLLVAE